jgi:hypothetical protein
VTTVLTCDECRELAPEFALGILDGAVRAQVLAHVVACPACRAYVDELGRTADTLLLAGPEAEPPLGFEASTLALMRATAPRAPRWRTLVAAAVIAVFAASAGVLVGRASLSNELRSAALVAADGKTVGQIYLHGGDGEPSWCYLSLTAPDNSGKYDVLASLRNGRTVVIQNFAVRGGHGTYGTQMDVNADDIVQVRVNSTTSSWAATADLAT